ncbi:androgen-dependent TFPI-regulating protein-like [Adelges cooleyi]|uniref:androgen-dependent TFPI-regulating protein-like n=1 Tax=Adelges cooleyi TaxID=133065 RepID=UPI00217FA6B0|nr:androgen-dependent TFPI-regulating protein-like [Adelges cooleyi]XP_050423621.1 androgen-dependent TFPI-regulating protein-like [Adelges cooleyi]XP_050423622.1 androgen-dependent TFPI-regulating protein-like [Adelges cooleyi]XP_050423623.1 androgen-dependent TFPI-regulating protein-like [Adelges cooleyi]XP_050423624.1 androgen-dependent TFPI-regulating protein-like [Adelges cooleyi]
MNVLIILDTINKGVHLSGAALFSYGLYYYYTFVNIPAHLNPLDEAFGGKFKYLTFCDLAIQTLYHMMAVLIDQLASKTCSDGTLKILNRCKNIYFTALAFPLSMFVAVSFWPMWLTDQTLVMPKYYDLYFPVWLNHVSHAHIFLFALLEIITAYKKYPSRAAGLTIYLSFQACYLFWINFIFYKTGLWVYPILERLNLITRVLFFVANFIYAPFTYLAGEYINNWYWSVSKYSKSSKHID